MTYVGVGEWMSFLIICVVQDDHEKISTLLSQVLKLLGVILLRS
jgi:hypothetical protein